MMEHLTLISKIKSFCRRCRITGALIPIGLLFSCMGNVTDYTEIDQEPSIIPDYSLVTIPPNIAPMNFIVDEQADKYQVKIYVDEVNSILLGSGNGKIMIPLKKWKILLERGKGGNIYFEVFIKREGKWLKYKEITNHIAMDPIDSYLVYRLIAPGYEMWNEMGIYQRNLENFSETAILTNDLSEKNCINCHSFCNHDSHTMLFHMRGKLAGTIIYRNGETLKVNTKTSGTISPGVYPYWHPDGRTIAFSSNQTVQAFHAVHGKRIEVLDTLSNIIIYDAELNKILKYDLLASPDRFETFPCWAPDGKYLYFCSAKSLPPDKYDQILYDLLRIEYDPESQRFGDIDTIVSSSRTGLSVSLPRISPDGKYLMFCMSGYGNFTIWHNDSDLYLLDLESGSLTKPDINSDMSESYHQWSSDGRWIVFSSRRTDGLFTRPYLSYFDGDGKANKPFKLPQKDPGFYDRFFKSYNIPEFIRSAVDLDPRKLAEIAKKQPVNASFEKRTNEL